MEEIKINFGCGKDIRKGWINVDKRDFGQELIYDLNMFPYPFDDDTADAILMQDILEHLVNPEKVLKEIYRISKNGATVVIRTPHPKSPHMKRDPEHVSAIPPSFLKDFSVFPADVIYYHCQRGLLFYWNQTVVLRVKK
ncbi:MAG: methyltransferase domain-containing protein [Thermoplasmata archaeon]|nr:methyltransferase domain-containing protein [Thermoplasmata archaeon]